MQLPVMRTQEIMNEEPLRYEMHDVTTAHAEKTILESTLFFIVSSISNELYFS